MYGIVLMAALATGSGTPSADATPPVGAVVAVPYTGGCFSSGCCGGVVVSGCCGGYFSSCTGCYSSSCTGCCGGGFLGLRTHMRSHFSRSSCTGCYSSSCFGSSCYSSSCFGSSCCGGACYGSACYGGGAHYYGSDFHGGYSTYAPSTIPHVSIPSMPMEFEAARTKPNAAPARLTVDVPAEAKLYVDGQLTKGQGATRNFHTPDLTDGLTFFYDLKVELTVDGKVLSETKRVMVRSGEVLTESFPKLIAATKDSATLAATTR